MDIVLKGFLQGSIPVVVFVGGAHHLTKKFKASKPVLYYGSLLAGLGLAYAVVEGKIKAPFMNAEEDDLYYCSKCDEGFSSINPTDEGQFCDSCLPSSATLHDEMERITMDAETFEAYKPSNDELERYALDYGLGGLYVKRTYFKGQKLEDMLNDLGIPLGMVKVELVKEKALEQEKYQYLGVRTDYGSLGTGKKLVRDYIQALKNIGKLNAETFGAEDEEDLKEYHMVLNYGGMKPLKKVLEWYSDDFSRDEIIEEFRELALNPDLDKDYDQLQDVFLIDADDDEVKYAYSYVTNQFYS
jgi:hypothetical protein